MRQRTVAAALVLFALAVVAPLAGVAVADASRPVIPPAGPVGPDPAGEIEAMPAAPSTPVAISSAFSPLPLVELATGSAPRPFLTRYRTAAVSDAKAMAGLVELASDEFRIDATGRAALDALLTALLVEPEAPPEASGGTGDEGTNVFDTAAFRAIAERAKPAIVATPANATALNDLAVATFAAGIPRSGSDVASTVHGRPLASAGQLGVATTTILELAAAWFQSDRAVTIDRAYFTSLYPEDGQRPSAARIALGAYVADHPSDVTARSLLAFLELRADPAHGLEAATGVAKPLIGDPSTEAAGRLIDGDTLIRAAEGQGTKSPFLTRSILLRALADYDRAIALSGDPVAYAGRAAALNLLGRRTDAVAAQREAVTLGVPSVVRQLHLAELESCVDGEAGWLDDGRAAFGLARDASTALPGLTFMLEGALDRGYGGYSVGSDALAVVTSLPVPATGGAAIATLEPFPRPLSCMSRDVLADGATDTTATEAWHAAIATGDRTTARTVLAAWDATIPPSADPEDPTVDLPSAPFSAITAVLDGGTLDPNGEPLDLTLMDFGRLPPAIEADVCSTLLVAEGLTGDDATELVICQTEAAYRRGDDAAALALIEPVVAGGPGLPSSGSSALPSGLLNELTGQLDIARERYLVAASRSDTAIAGLQRLGDLDIRDGDGAAAVDHYDLALATVQTQSIADSATFVDLLDAEAARQYLENNRGIALLMTARAKPDAPPDCAAFEAACRQAADAFDAAAAVDPMNPIYAMNQAWVARLTGDAARATAKLTEALANGTPLGGPVHNDLAVLAARRGDLDEAAAQLRAALAAEPDYDLALWNLGVLEARQAGPDLVAGQALLADATRVNSDLLGKELTFVADERVYRIEVNGVELQVARAPGTGAAVGAAAFGAIATVGAIGQLISGLGGDLQDAAGTVTEEGLARGSRRLRGLGLRRMRGPGGDTARRWPSWLAWIPAIAVLVVTTAWTAAWIAPDAFGTAVLLGLTAAALAIVVHACGHLVVAGRLGASLKPSGWVPGLGLAIVGMPFHVPAGPFLAEDIVTGDPGRDWWVSIAGVLANLAAAGIAFVVYLGAPMPFLRILIATNLAVAAFALIPSHPLDGDRLSSRPIVLALLGLGVAAASTAIAVGAI